MIQKIQIRNFQSHRNTSLELDPGVNIIIGQSDSGKTSVLRALRWALTNRPSGDAYRSNWGGKTIVKLTLEDGNRIERIKDKTTVNKYILNEKEFVAFGNDVPDEILKVLNLNEINLQAQFDQPYLLTATPGEVARHFNKIAHIDQIDISVKKVQSWIRKLDQDIESRKLAIQEGEEELKEYDGLEKFEIEIEIAEELEKEYNLSIRNVGKLENTIADVEEIEAGITGNSYILELEDQVEDALSLFEKINVINSDLILIKDSITTQKNLTSRIKEYEGILKLESLVLEGLTLCKKMDLKIDDRNFLEAMVLEVQNFTRQITGWEIKEIELTKKFKKEMPAICPLCNQKITK